MPVLPINYLEFESVDLDRSRDFFSQAFGWTFVEYGRDYLALDNAGLDGGLARSDKAAPPLAILYADDLDAAEAAIRGAGGEITREQFDFPGGRRLHFREPGGNEMAVWSKPN